MKHGNIAGIRQKERGSDWSEEKPSRTPFSFVVSIVLLLSRSFCCVTTSYQHVAMVKIFTYTHNHSISYWSNSTTRMNRSRNRNGINIKTIHSCDKSTQLRPITTALNLLAAAVKHIRAYWTRTRIFYWYDIVFIPHSSRAFNRIEIYGLCWLSEQSNSKESYIDVSRSI